MWGSSQEMCAWRGGPACTALALCVSLRCGWHAAPPSITCDDESHRRLPPSLPVRSRWRWQSAHWHWAQMGECQAQASGWRRPATGEWGADCGQRRSPRCPVVDQSAADAHAKPPGLKGKRSLMLGWGQEERGGQWSVLLWPKKIMKTFNWNFICKSNEAKRGKQWINGLFWIVPCPWGQSDRRWCGNTGTIGLPANPCQWMFSLLTHGKLSRGLCKAVCHSSTGQMMQMINNLECVAQPCK